MTLLEGPPTVAPSLTVPAEEVEPLLLALRDGFTTLYAEVHEAGRDVERLEHELAAHRADVEPAEEQRRGQVDLLVTFGSAVAVMAVLAVLLALIG